MNANLYLFCRSAQHQQNMLTVSMVSKVERVLNESRLCRKFYIVYVGVVCGAIKSDLVYSLLAKAVVTGSEFHNLTLPGKNKKACWSIIE